MTVADTLQQPEPGLIEGQAGDGRLRRKTSYLHSLRYKGYVFFGLVLAYMLLATVFFFSQRPQPLAQLEEYRLIQQAQAALVETNGALFDALVALQGLAEPRQAEDLLARLRQEYRSLAGLMPEQTLWLNMLERNLPSPDLEPAALYREGLRAHLATARTEIDRLFASNRLRLTYLAQEYRRKDDLLVAKSLVLGTLGLILIGAVTTLFFNRLKSDLLRLQQRAAEIVRGFRGAPLPVTRRDELGHLTEGINYLSQALAEKEQAIEIERRKTSFRDKMVAIDSLAGGIAHEVGNPIACISGLAAEIADDSRNRLSAESRAMLEQLQQYTSGLVRVSRDLAQLDCGNIDESEWIDINHLLGSAVKLCHYDNRWAEISIELELDSGLPAWYASETQFNQLCMHILENALDALAGRNGASLAVKTCYDTQHGIEISFRDNGIGVARSDLEKIFEPFYTTKATGEGSGLGLAICSAIVKSHGGSIRARSLTEGGLEIVVRFPPRSAAWQEAGS